MASFPGWTSAADFAGCSMLGASTSVPFAIRDALDKLALCTIEIQTNAGFRDYDEQYQSMVRNLDPTSSTERAFIQFLYENSLRLPDAAQKRVDGIYCQPDFYYEPRFRNFWL